MKNSFYTFIFWLILIMISKLNAQGCSDAGFCSIGAMKSQDSYQSELMLGFTYEQTTNEVLVLQQFLQFQYSLNEDFSVAAKLMSKLAVVNSFDNFGVSDLFLSSTFTAVKISEEQGVRATLGAKIPLSIPESTFFDFEPSLGIYEAIAGLSYFQGYFQIAIGYQQPLTDITFMINQGEANFKRGADVLIKPTYRFNSNHWTFQPSVMAIYRLSEDQLTQSNTLDLFSNTITGPKGLTLNVMSDIQFKFPNQNRMNLMLALPVINRENIIDGLGRTFVASLSYSITF